MQATELTTTPGFDITAVQTIVAKSANDTTMEMVKALMSGQQAGLNFNQLAAKHIDVKFEDVLSQSDAKTTMVYNKLFQATQEHIKNNSIPLVMTFALMNKQTGNEASSKLFLGSFVLPAAKDMVEKLKTEQPGALECFEIWQ